MRVVVITLAKDDLQGLRRTMNSISNQTIKVAWRIVTPNDQSPTHQFALEILQMGLVDKVTNDDGLGIYHAMNFAISELNDADWVWFLNSGDEFGSGDAYSFVFGAVAASTHRWIYGGHFLGSSSGALLGENAPPDIFRPKDQLFARRHISHQSSIFNIAFLRELGGFDERYHLASDWDLMVRASKIDLGMRLSKPISIFYMGGASTRSRALGNKELLTLRNTHLPHRFLMKSYTWFYYRTCRNSVVQLAEQLLPRQTDKVRKARIILRKNVRAHWK